jgi:hypothetical protein
MCIVVGNLGPTLDWLCRSEAKCKYLLEGVEWGRSMWIVNLYSKALYLSQMFYSSTGISHFPFENSSMHITLQKHSSFGAIRTLHVSAQLTFIRYMHSLKEKSK